MLPYILIAVACGFAVMLLVGIGIGRAFRDLREDDEEVMRLAAEAEYQHLRVAANARAMRQRREREAACSRRTHATFDGLDMPGRRNVQ